MSRRIKRATLTLGVLVAAIAAFAMTPAASADHYYRSGYCSTPRISYHYHHRHRPVYRTHYARSYRPVYYTRPYRYWRPSRYVRRYYRYCY